MITNQLSSELSLTELPDRWRTEIPALAPEENVLSALEVDLDSKLHFHKGLVLLTERRIMARAPGETVWRDWTYRAGMSLKLHDHAGVGHLELVDDTQRLAAWRFTLGQNLLAIRLSENFPRLLEAHIHGKPLQQVEQNSCPTCKAPLEADQ